MRFSFPPRSRKNTVVSSHDSPCATVECDCAKTVSATCDVEVTGIPAILLEVVDIEDPVQVGSRETYLIRATNQGSAPGTNIRIAATLEPNMRFVSADGATRGAGRGLGVTFDPLASLAPGEEAEWRIVVEAVSAGDVRFKVSMTSDQLTRPVEESEATNVYE